MICEVLYLEQFLQAFPCIYENRGAETWELAHRHEDSILALRNRCENWT